MSRATVARNSASTRPACEIWLPRRGIHFWRLLRWTRPLLSCGYKKQTGRSSILIARCPPLPRTRPLYRHYRSTTTTAAAAEPPAYLPPMGKRHATADDLLAQAEANGYRRGEHREEDEVRDRHKHVKKTKKDQDAALNRYIL